MKTKNLILVAALFLCLVLGGCLTSKSPFYEEKNVIQDAHFFGDYYSEDFPVTIVVTASQTEAGRYLVRLSESGIWSEYLATLFKNQNDTYVDLFPVKKSDSSKAVPQGSPNYPTVNQLLNLIAHDQSAKSDGALHLIYRVEITEACVKFWVPKKGSDPTNILAKSSKVHTRLNGDGLIVDESTAVLRSLFDKGGEGIAVFQPDPATLKRGTAPN